MKFLLRLAPRVSATVQLVSPTAPNLIVKLNKIFGDRSAARHLRALTLSIAFYWSQPLSKSLCSSS